MKRLITFLVLVLSLQSCKQSSNTEQATKSNAMDTTATAIKQNGVQGPEGFLYVDDNENGERLPIVFTHSFGGSSEHWKNQLEYFRKKNNRAVVFDFRSHGKSEPSEQQLFTAEALAGDIAAVVDSLDLDHFILVGHSMGGASAIAYASANADRVAGLVLLGTPGKSLPEQSAPIIASLESDKYQMVMDQYMKQLLTDAKPEVDSMVMSGVKNISKETSINVIKSLFEFDPLPALKNYTGPVMIVTTPREKSQPNSLVNQVPKIPSKIIDGTSHWAQLDKPDEFNKILDDFVKKVEAGMPADRQ